MGDQLVTRIGVVDFDDYNYISKYGENLYDLVDGGQITASVFVNVFVRN